jgi:hypothetical protein
MEGPHALRNGYRQETRSMRKCVYRKQLDLETLVAMRGPNFPSRSISQLSSQPGCREWVCRRRLRHAQRVVAPCQR